MKSIIMALILGFLLMVINHPILGADVYAESRPLPFKEQVNKLEAIQNDLVSIHRRLQDILSINPEKVASVPQSIVGKLKAMTNQIQTLEKHLQGILLTLQKDPTVLPTGVEDVLHHIWQYAYNIGYLARDGGSFTKPEPVVAALATLKQAIERIHRPLIFYINAGYFEWQTLYYMNIYPMIVCNDDGSMCGQVTFETVKSVMDGTNALMYRSGSKIRVRPRLTYMPKGLWETMFNSSCRLAPLIKVVETTLQGESNPVEVLARLHFTPNSYHYEIIESGDLNGDGLIDEKDANTLCAPWNGDELEDKKALEGKIIQEDQKAALVYIRGGTQKVKWDNTHNVWRHYRHTYNASSCLGLGILMNNDMGGANGNSFSHELGHYLCNPHTFGSYIDPNSPKSIYNQLEEKIIEAREYLCSSKPSSCNPDEIVKFAFDHDDEHTYSGADTSYWYIAYNQAAFEVDNYPVNDTPADPGPDVWTELYGDACFYGKPSVTFNIDGVLYEVKPDRTNIMSYFKSCFPNEARFSPDQVKRAELTVTELHRKPVTEVLDVKTWRNTKLVKIEDATSLPIFWDKTQLKWSLSPIWVNDSEQDQVKRAVVGVKIFQKANEGGLHIELIDPDGNIHSLQKPADNIHREKNRVSSLFYVNTPIKNGIWLLRVAEEPNFIGGLGGLDLHEEGYIYDWQIQFETN